MWDPEKMESYQELRDEVVKKKFTIKDLFAMIGLFEASLDLWLLIFEGVFELTGWNLQTDLVDFLFVGLICLTIEIVDRFMNSQGHSMLERNRGDITKIVQLIQMVIKLELSVIGVSGLVKYAWMKFGEPNTMAPVSYSLLAAFTHEFIIPTFVWKKSFPVAGGLGIVFLIILMLK